MVDDLDGQNMLPPIFRTVANKLGSSKDDYPFDAPPELMFMDSVPQAIEGM